VKTNDISVVIPSFNGKELLAKYLPSVTGACKRYAPGKIELIVVDDASTDGTAQYLKSDFPSIKIVAHDTNKGFARSANDGVYSAAHDIVVLLNNDVELYGDFFAYFAGYFEDDAVFAVRPGLKNSAEDDVIKDSKTSGGFKNGFFEVTKIAKTESRYAFFAGGGCSAFDKSKFVKLGGFDEIFSPFYFEDVDLSYRAWKAGWKVMYEPKCLAYHRGNTTISKLYKDNFVDIICERNRYFLVWKNITDKTLLLRHFAVIPARLAVTLLLGRTTYFRGFLMAAGKLKEILRKRKIAKASAVKPDMEIMEYFKQ
jgi:O-antigen biosynthesis protein